MVGLAVLGVMGAGQARADNLVINGSFEDGLNGWTIGGTDGQGFPPVAILYDSTAGYPTGAFGEPIPHNNAWTPSTDPVGDHAAYFVSDLGENQSLYQTIHIAEAGIYQIGFSAYAPLNGYNNAGDASFVGRIADDELANYNVHESMPQQWVTYSGAQYLDVGPYLVEFVFNTSLVPSADVVIDQVYVIKGNPQQPVPDGGATLVLLGLGLTGLGLARRRRG